MESYEGLQKKPLFNEPRICTAYGHTIGCLLSYQQVAQRECTSPPIGFYVNITHLVLIRFEKYYTLSNKTLLNQLCELYIGPLPNRTLLSRACLLFRL